MSERNFESARRSPFYKAQIKILNFMKQVENILENRNISQKELAATMGVSQSYISKLFNCHVNISMLTMEKLAAAVNQEISQPELYDTSILCYKEEDFTSRSSETKFVYSNDNIDFLAFTKNNENYSQQIKFN
jgi:transcriptional regulator with XRE-family HTH domain|nr:MAG TPA: Helix-turn-helix XRE-family like protein [Caudoviricetes sp.]